MVEFVAEVSSNHNRDLSRCLKFIEVAKECGCDAVKFQLFKVKKLFAKEILEKSHKHRDRIRWELPVDFLPHIAEKCRNIGIKFICTPFYLEAVDELEPYVDAYKIASYELLWLDLFKKCAETSKPVIVSTGMATLNEIQNAVDTLTFNGCKDVTILQCVSAYPAPIKDCNLSAIETMRREIKVDRNVTVKFGWSDHSVNEGVILRAIHKWGAQMVEFHFDIDGEGEEFGFGHCWLPDRVERMIKMVRDGFEADGNGEKVPQASEMDDRMWRADPEDGLRPLKELRVNWTIK
ncbi:N-acetylneuraminate synthase family protein [Hippea jasoniae]|uniref:N-acetylneuraminate synthase family protein n=1 Tax=Hippea jasoniae TaxID=944479 RepID=UPI000553EDC1|nr:N-acetylneuraminate synthase family protein [Hippea jasoniae]